MFFAVSCLSQFVSARSQRNSFREDQLQKIMFADDADIDKYAEKCGHHWLSIFARWEQRQKRALNNDATVQAVVWRCRDGCGGLGDRQRGILTSFMLALVTDRAFFIDNETPVPLRHYFHVANPTLHWVFHEDMLQNRSVLEEDFRGELPSIGDYSTANLSRYKDIDILIQTNSFWQPFNILRNPAFGKSVGYLRSYDDSTLAGCVLNYLMVPSRDLQVKVLDLRKPAKASVHHPVLAVQVRSGDSQNKNMTVIAKLVQLFDTCIVKIQNDMSSRPQIFLTTDSEEVVAEFEKLYPDMLSFAGQIYHVDGPFGSPSSPDSAFGKIVMDQLMLSQANKLLISRSGFGELAAIRGFQSYHTPVNCVADTPVERYLFPDKSPSGVPGDDINSVDAVISGFGRASARTL